MTDTTTKIRSLNDHFRATFAGGQVMLTPGITGLSEDQRADVLLRVAAFDDFSEDNDPHGEHDFGSFDLDGKRIMWKIDYYDSNLEYGSPDPADPGVTTRVLTILLAEEY
jgi:hypothetical protein